jgi:hypothetical protein
MGKHLHQHDGIAGHNLQKKVSSKTELKIGSPSNQLLIVFAVMNRDLAPSVAADFERRLNR